MSDTHPFFVLTELINEFNTNRNSMTLPQLQDLRENISLNLFLMADSSAKAIANLTDCSFSKGRCFSRIQKSQSGRSQASQTLLMVLNFSAKSRPKLQGLYLAIKSDVFIVSC